MPAFYELNYYARTFYTGDGGTQDFLVTFYGGAPLEPGHIKVYVDQTEVFSGWSLVTVNNATKVRFEIPPAETSAGNVMLRRVTPATAATRVIDFSDGSVLTASDLDKSQLNSLYVSQESSDLFLDQGGAGVSINFAETITGSKTFTGTTTIAPEGFLKFTQGLDIIADKTQNGKQYVLGANGITGDVHWEETTINPGSLPSSVVQADIPYSPQVISAPKTFTGSTVISGGLKVTGTSVSGQALVSNTSDGTVAWSPIVNAIKLGSGTAASSTGTVVITPASIGAIAVGATGATQTVAGPVNFSGSVGLGSDVSASVLNVTGTFKLNLQDGDEPIGKVLTCTGVDGTSAWQPAASSGITSVNGLSGTNGAVTITADQLGAVSTATNQTITGAKTFTNNVTLGTDSNDIIVIGGELQIPGATANGQVLMSSAGNKAIWQTATAAGVSSVNGATGPITISADSLGAYTPAGAYPLPIATGNQKGIMQVGSGLAVTDGVVSVTQNATLPIATANVLGGIRIGSGLSINAQTGVVSATLNGAVGVNLFNGRAGDVTPATADYTAAQVTNAVDTNTAQDITASKKFTVIQTVSTANGAIGNSGSVGVSINPTGIIKAQSSAVNTHVIEAISPTGGVMAWVDSDGDATFSGKVTANGGFESSAGMTIGQNASSIINITGSLQVLGGGSPGIGKVLTCQDATVGAVAWQTPSNAPVSSVAVNGGTALTGAVNIVADGNGSANGLGAVTKTGTQTITGTKTFSVAQDFQAGMKLGLVLTDDIEVKGTLRIPTSPAAGKVLTSDATGKAGWSPSLITSVNTQTGAVVITPGNIGAATTADITSLTTQITTANTNATNASTDAASALSTANSKLSYVSTLPTDVGGTPAYLLTGNGTDGSPLQVLNAPPVGPAAGDLIGTYPSPTIGTNKVTYGKMQQVGASRLLGNAAGSVANVTEISLGNGLSFSGGQLTNAAIPTVSASGTNTFTGANTFQGNVTVGDAAGDALTVNATMSTVAPVTLGAASGSTSQITVHGPLTITSGSPGVAKVLTSNATGVATWEAPVSPVQWTVNHHLAERRLFGSYNVTDVNPGNQTINTGMNTLNLSSFTVGRQTKYLIRSGSTSASRQVQLVIGAGQSCYFMAKDSGTDFAYQAAVGVLFTVATPAISTATASYTFPEPTLHTGPTTVLVISSGSGPSGWISLFRVS